MTWETLAFQAGERVTVSWSDLSQPAATVELLIPGDVTVDSRIGAGAVTYLFAEDADVGGNSQISVGVGTWSISCGDDLLTSERTSTSAPTPTWIQAYGRPSRDATCLDGWDGSWQLWAELVTGGWVCTRSIPATG